MKAAIFATKKRNILSPKHDVIITSSWGQSISEHTHSEGGNDVTVDTLYRHLTEPTEERRVAIVSRNQIELMEPFDRTLRVKSGWNAAAARYETEASQGARPAVSTWLFRGVAHFTVQRGSEFQGTGFTMFKVF